MGESLMEVLVEEQLGSVVFVMDYVQLDFNHARFTAHVWPTVATGETLLRFGDSGYRDALCAFITHEVTSVEESAAAGLVIRFGIGEIAVHPSPTEVEGPEIAELQVHADSFRESSWMLWPRGEGVFAGPDWA